MSALLFFDIDGTLITLDERHMMPESTKEALHKAKQNGHKIFINSGRVRTSIDKTLLDFEFDGLVCGCGTYIEYEGKEIFHHTLTKAECLSYAELLKKYRLQTIFEGKDRIFVEGNKEEGHFLKYIYEAFEKNTDQPIEGADSPDFIYDKFTACPVDSSDMEGFKNTFSKDFNLIPHFGSVYEAVPKPYSKASGIQTVVDYLGADLSDCYAFGDSINDMEMLKYVPHAVGMGNAVPEVLEVVEHRTDDVTKDGIKKALEHYGLI